MKKRLLVLAIFMISALKMFAATDISDHSKVLSFYFTPVTYDGKVTNLAISLTDAVLNKDLIPGTDFMYTMSYKGNLVNAFKDAGEYTITMSGMGDYTGNRVEKVTISPASMNDVIVTGVNTAYPYTGSQITPTPTVSLGSVALTSNDFAVSYGENMNAATGGSVILNPGPSGNLTGQKTVNFTITPIDISHATTVINLNPTTYPYTGSPVTPTIQSVTVNGNTITTSDYMVNTPAEGTNTNTGNATVTITGQGNYTGTASQNFVIGTADLSGATITLSPDSYEYTGSVITPNIQSVVLNGRTLTLNTDYTVNTPADGTNMNVGTGNIAITGMGNYTGTASKDFTITGVPLTDNMFVAIATKKHTGSPITLTDADITTSYNSNPLAFGTDYTITGYQSNTDIGTASVTFTGAGNFTGSVTKNFQISTTPLTASMFTIANKTYTGKGIELTDADITGKDGAKTLVLGTDYEIESYANNTNAGTATVVLKGKGDYSGTAPVNFTIDPLNLAGQSVITLILFNSKTYTGSPIELNASDVSASSANGLDLVFGTDYTVGNYSNNTNVGNATVTITGKGNFTGEFTQNFAITAAPLTSSMFSIANKAYTGSGVTLTQADITASDNGTPLTFGTDYTLGDYTANTNAGTATVMINGAGKYSGSVPVNFTIVPATITASMFTAIADKPYTGAPVTLTAADITSPLAFDTDYTIGSYTANIAAGTATVVFNGKGNYKGTTDPVNFKITPVALTAAMVSVPKQYYSGTLIQPQPTVKIGDVVLPNSSYTVSYPDTQAGAYVEPGTYNIKIDAVEGSSISGSVTTTFQIVEAPQTYFTITIPEVDGITTDPVAGTYDVTYGDYFSFYITVDEEANPLRAGLQPAKHITVKANGVESNPVSLGNGRYLATINNITENVIVEIIVTDEPPVSNINPESDMVKVYSVDGMLYIETPETATVNVFTLTGQLKYQNKVNGMISIPASRGIYMVKVGSGVHKVVVR